jgi:hypothetical protein
MTTKNKKKSPLWLRILEISAGLLIIALGVAAFYPGVSWSRTALLAFLAVALIILEISYIVRIFAKGISGRRGLNLILSVLATLIAVLVLVLSFYVVLSYYGFILILLDLLALGLFFAGIANAVRGTVGGKIVGLFGIFIGVFVLIDLHIPVIVAVFIFLFRLIRPVFPLSTDVAALITLSLTIFGLEPIISGIVGRWV